MKTIILLLISIFFAYDIFAQHTVSFAVNFSAPVECGLFLPQPGNSTVVRVNINNWSGNDFVQRNEDSGHLYPDYYIKASYSDFLEGKDACMLQALQLIDQQNKKGL